MPTAQSERRLRVAVLSRRFSTTGGGAERYSIALVEHLAAQHEIHVFAQVIDHQWPGIVYHLVSKPCERPRWINQLWYAWATWWDTRRGFDVVHSHENTWHGQVQTVHVLPIKYNLFLGRTGWVRAARWIKVLTSPRLLTYLALEGARFSLKQSRTLVMTSQTLVAQTLQVYPQCQSAIEVITPGVDRVAGGADAAEKLAARATLGLPQAGFGLLFVGNDYQKKGLETLMSALVQLPPGCFLAVVGSTAQVPVFKARAQTLGLAQRVYFLGSLRDMHPAYVASDCLAHPTREDTFAMVVLEAMAHGLPTVVSGARYCGIAALLRHEQDALVLDNPLDASALALALTRLQQDSVLVERLRSGGVNFAEKHLWSAMASQQDQVYQRTVDSD